MEVVRNEQSETWHLLGARGCGERPDGEHLDAPWPKIRDRVERDDGTRCANCQWP
jgi:hypothetical protein